MAATSRMNRKIHVRICGRLEMKFLWPTRRIVKKHHWHVPPSLANHLGAFNFSTNRYNFGSTIPCCF
jgi:hypothetical protein